MAQEQLNSGAVEMKAKKPPQNGVSGAEVRAMSDEDEAMPAKKTSFARFMRDVILIGALLGGGMYAYRTHVVTKEKVGKLGIEAAEKMEKNDLASLKEAEKIYQEILELDGDSELGLAGLAEAYYLQSEHGVDSRARAEEYVRKAAAENSPRPERYATEIYLKIAAGNAGTAEREAKDLIDQGRGSSKLMHAYGWAKAEQGDYVEGNRIVRGALDTDFNATRFALTLAEIAHRQGDERAAVRHLKSALGSAMNPNHEIALAWAAALTAKNYGTIAQAAKYIQDVQAKKDQIGPRAQALLTWAEGELALALGNAGDKEGALEKADTVLGQLKDWPPALDLKARALSAMGKGNEALEAYEKAAAAKPEYRGIKLDLARLKSERKDDAALAMLDDLEKSNPGAGPEYEILRGEHYLNKGELEKAKAAFEKAADLGDDPMILLGLAKLTFEEEKKKGKKAELDKVASAIELTMERRSTFPEVQELLAKVELWNFNLEGAKNAFGEAEKQYKKLNRSTMFMVRFYDRAAATMKGIEDPKQKGAAEKAAAEWEGKKKEFLATAITSNAE